jgi:hypothetical protein
MASDSDFTSMERSPSPLSADTNSNVGVGLSSALINLSRRKMLDLVNKLISTSGRRSPSDRSHR